MLGLTARPASNHSLTAMVGEMAGLAEPTEDGTPSGPNPPCRRAYHDPRQVPGGRTPAG
jgi:hypothetical protein